MKNEIRSTKRPVCSFSNNIDMVYHLQDDIVYGFLNGSRPYREVKDIKSIVYMFEHNTKNDMVYASERDKGLILKYLKEGANHGEQDNLQTQYGNYSDINRGNDRSAC